ncbi:MAG: lipoyl(octanoyl) transferase LipB [Bacteroidetes bacterium]|nr:lipoyl(octanoyl) transferase LipB [Bacteroidota bacterium]MCL5737647.1 lipoyl(octanoyl) transferase LipB [Bacteroidota bacterium]
MNKTLLIDIGITEYAAAWDLQKALHHERVSLSIPDTVLFTEHFNTYTIGKSGGDDHLLATKEELHEGNVSVFKIDRGGDITYHGPGQIVCYPIIDLNNYYLDIHRYMRDLEEVVIRTLDQFGIKAHREPEYTGVWVDGEKICAIGVKVSRWVTMHGFAFNVNTDLSYFGRIIPCGIFHKGVTSLSQLLERTIDISEVKKVVAEKFAEVFQTEIESASFEQFIQKFHINMEKEHASS